MFAIKRLKGIKEKVDRGIDRQLPSGISKAKKLQIYFDYLNERLVHKISHANYFEYEFYKKKQLERRTFITSDRAHYIYDLCNPKELRYLTGDKATFNRRYDSLLKRKWLDVKAATFEEYCLFVNSLDRIFVKPASGEKGQGIGLFINDGTLCDREHYERYVAQQAVLEEVIQQHPTMALLNPTSVNTIRVVTLRDAKEQVHIMATVLRMGRSGGVVDNFHNNGICAGIEPESGLVYTSGINFDHERFIRHPDSGVPIVGFQIPAWSKILDTVYSAAALMTELRYTGWDLAVNHDGEVQLIEGNSTPDSDLTQIADQVGKWADYEMLIRELEKMRR